ncbi:hypothetical protein D9613_005704 [Agrocybe pediades]|uniref:Protein kinase domain-containing protein n=1 Tax=Agrocybe pediades TaxID=84607 RepID=A0A8H4VQ12_9AGAR|nr:hypothetical protein D9613_005704 [Agrocybe pediades]
MPVTLLCAYPAEIPIFFDVEVEPSKHISTLREAIYAKLKLYESESYGGLKLKDLKLLNVAIPTRPKDTRVNRIRNYLHVHSSDAPLQNIRTVDAVFGTEQSSDVRVLVFTSEIIELLDVLAEPETASHKRKIRKNLKETVKRKGLSRSPSDAIKSSSSVQELITGCQVHINHVPVALFNSALAKLQQCLDDPNFLVTDAEVKWAADYIRLATSFYPDESARNDAIKSTINSALGSDGKWETRLEQKADSSSYFTPDAFWDTEHDKFILMLLEAKNVPGLWGDPKLQCVADLLKVVSNSKYDTYRGACNFPVVLIGIAGCRLQVSMAVYVGAVLVSDLVEIDLSRFGFHASDVTIRVAQIFKALSNCRKDLQKYYADIERRAKSATDITFLYPQPISATETPLPKIIYDQFLDHDGKPLDKLPDFENRTTAMYTGALDGKQVVVKFTRRYNAKAHQILADAGFAPQLHFCGLIVGNLYMVVMDYMPEAKCLADYEGDDSIGILPLAIEKVGVAVALLHAQNIVFADLRCGNIMVCGEHDKSVKLVDFD